jgi:hypothetical protein
MLTPSLAPSYFGMLTRLYSFVVCGVYRAGAVLLRRVPLRVPDARCDRRQAGAYLYLSVYLLSIFKICRIPRNHTHTIKNLHFSHVRSLVMPLTCFSRSKGLASPALCSQPASTPPPCFLIAALCPACLHSPPLFLHQHRRVGRAPRRPWVSCSTTGVTRSTRCSPSLSWPPHGSSASPLGKLSLIYILY